MRSWSSRLRNALPPLVCAVAGGVVLASARGYLEPGTPYGDDHSSHLAVIWSVAEDLRAGRTDFHFPGANLGVPLFLSYPPLATVGVAALAAAFGGAAAATFLFELSIALSWALMPLAWYAGGRWLGLDRRTAAIFGLLSIGIVDRDARGLSMTSALHTGLYSQNFGMLLLPLALGALSRWMTGPADVRAAARAIVLLWLTCLAHAVAGLAVCIASALLVAVASPGSPIRTRGARLVLASGAAFLLLGFWLWPMLAHDAWVGGIPWKKPMHDGRPLDAAARMLLGGDLLDAERFPWMTILFLFGIARAWRDRRSALEAWTLAGLAVFLALFLGPTTFGPLFRSLPLQGELNVSRYLIGIHFFAALLAAKGASWLVEESRSIADRRFGSASAAVVAAFLVLVVGAYLAERHEFGRRAFRAFDPAEPAFAALVDHLRQQPGARIVADAQLGTTTHFYRDLLPALVERPQIQSYGMTFHSTLATYYTEYFDFSPAACRLYGVDALIGRNGKVPAEARSYPKSFDDGHHQVYDCPNPEGAFVFVELPISIEGEPKSIRRAVRATLPLYEHGRLARLLPPGAPASLRAARHFSVDGTVDLPAGLERAVEELSTRAPSPLRGRVLESRVDKTRAWAEVEVDAGRAWLVWKTNAFPYWRATVDGEPVEIANVAPTYQAVSVPAGRHRVVFEYRVPAWSKAAAGASLPAALGLAIFGWMPRRRRDELVMDGPAPLDSLPASVYQVRRDG